MKALYIDPSGVISARINGQDYECADQVHATKILRDNYSDGNLLWSPGFNAIHPLPDNYSVEVKTEHIQVNKAYHPKFKIVEVAILIPSKESQHPLLTKLHEKNRGIEAGERSRRVTNTNQLLVRAGESQQESQEKLWREVHTICQIGPSPPFDMLTDKFIVTRKP